MRTHSPSLILNEQSFSSYHLEPMMCMRDVPVIPTTLSEKTLYNGGPYWPNWGGQYLPCHGRNGMRMNSTLAPIPDSLPRVEESLIWGGMVHRFFGHQVAEYSTRVLQASTERSSDRILFSLWPGGTIAQIPDFFWQIMDWYGVARERVLFALTPFIASEIWVAAQGEQLGGPGPSQAYLRLLENNARDRILQPVASRYLYVTREKMLFKGLACMMGESYFSARLGDLGAKIITPEELSVLNQLEHYAGAGTLIFAQGSAMHGRQLLGFLDQHIVVLQRRAHGRQALYELLPRCSRLTYCETAKGTISRINKDGSRDLVRGISVYDKDTLFSSMMRIGIDLESVWNNTDYMRQCETDLEIWVRAAFLAKNQSNTPIDWPAAVASVCQDLEKLGLAHMINKVENILKDS